LATGLGPGSDSRTGVEFGLGSGLLAVSGFAVGFTIAGSLPETGEAAGKMTTRGVGEAPGSGELSGVVEASSLDWLALS